MKSIKDTNCTFESIFPNLRHEHFIKLNNIDALYMQMIPEYLGNNKYYINRFINYIFGLIVNFDCTEEEKSILKSLLEFKIKNNTISRADYNMLLNNVTREKSLFYLKFGQIDRNMNYLSGITTKQLLNVNIKHVNMIAKYLKEENEDELSNTYAKAIKMYFIFGLERSLEILNGKYGKLNNYFFNALMKVNVSMVELIPEGNKTTPHIKKAFIDYMFAKKDDNHFIDCLKDIELKLSRYWYLLYNNFEEIKEKCNGTITPEKLYIILTELSNTKGIGTIEPDYYRLKENDVLCNILLGNKARRNDEEVYSEVTRIYDKMKLRTESSIPYVEGELPNGYRYETAKLDDPIIFTLGYIGNCCIRVHDIAHNHLLHAALCRNGRMLIIYNENGHVKAFSPLKRNGEVLIANSIECANRLNDKNAVEAFSKAIKDIVSTSKGNEEKPIRLVCIGNNSYTKPTTTEFPKSTVAPTIYEKDDPIYRDTDIYHRVLDIVYKDPKLNLDNIRYGSPSHEYSDPRPEICHAEYALDPMDDIRNAVTVINAIRYSKIKSSLDARVTFQKLEYYHVKKCIYNKDWYIVITSNNEIHGDYINTDPRAKEEYDKAYYDLLVELREQAMENEYTMKLSM